MKRAFHGWLDVFHILPSAISYEWMEKACNDDDSDGDVYFSVKTSFPYRSIRLTCYPVAANCDDEDTDRFLLHEAIHVMLGPLNKSRYEPWTTYQQFGEFVTENLTHYIWSCRLWDMDKDKTIKKLEAEIKRLKRR